MSLSRFELYHGAVLSRVIRNPDISLKLFERNVEQGWASYSVSDNQNDYLLYIKYTTKVRGDDKKVCHFTFSLEDIARLRKETDKSILVCLVCDSEEICLLDRKDLDALNILESNRPCNVSVSWTKGSSLTVKAARKKLNHKIPRNRLNDFEWK